MAQNYTIQKKGAVVKSRTATFVTVQVESGTYRVRRAAWDNEADFVEATLLETPSLQFPGLLKPAPGLTPEVEATPEERQGRRQVGRAEAERVLFQGDQSFEDREEALRFLVAEGVHVDQMDPTILGTVLATLVDGTMAPGLVLTALEGQGLITVTPYIEALRVAGFPEGFPVQEGFGRVIPTREGGVEVQKGAAFTKNLETGATIYRNGVVVTAEGQVLFDEGNAGQAGSTAWLRETVLKWDTARLEREKQLLVEQGFLDKRLAKVPGLTQEVASALREYQTQRYFGGGTALPSAAGLLARKDAAEDLPKFDFEQLQGRARAEVNNIFAELYADQPEEREMQRWSQAILDLAHELYRQGRGQLSPEQAYGEAAYRVQARQERSPQAEFEAENALENTELRDSLVRAAAVSNRMMRGS